MKMYDIKPTIKPTDIITKTIHGNFKAERIIDLRDKYNLPKDFFADVVTIKEILKNDKDKRDFPKFKVKCLN